MPLTRRDFLRGMGATVGGIGLSSAVDHLIPYVHQPEDLVPGESSWYATSCRECPAGCGMLVRTSDSRALKCEGNPVHPINRGRLCARGQASPQALYDPDRVKSPMQRSGDAFNSVTWPEAFEGVRTALTSARGVALVSDLQTSSLLSIMRQWLSAFGSDRLVIYEPIDYEAVKSTNGGAVPSYDIAGSDYLLSFDADFLGSWISPVEYTRQFTAMRELKNGRRSGFAFVGPRVSTTAVSADRRLIVPPGSEESVARAILSAMGGAGATGDEFDPEVIRRIARDLSAAKSPLALPGISHSAARAAALVNAATRTPLADAGRPHALTHVSARSEMDALISDMEAGKIDALLVYGANPVYSLPQSDRFVEALERVSTVVSLSSYMDETSMTADWILPSSTPLESWGDYEPYPGVVNIMQPVMGKVFDTMQTGDILMSLAGKAFKASSFYEFIRAERGHPLAPGETAETISQGWEAEVQRGGRWSPQEPSGMMSMIPFPLVVGGDSSRRSGSSPSVRAGRNPGSATGAASYNQGEGDDGEVQTEGVRLYAYPHIYSYDGRGANKRWLQELPEPLVKAAWGTWAEMHPSTAGRLGVRTDDLIEVRRDGNSIRVPAYVWEGVAPETIAVPMGQGHEHFGRYAKGIGVNVYPLLTGSGAVQVSPAGHGYVIRIKAGDSQSGREIVQTADLGRASGRDHEIVYPLPKGYGSHDFMPGHQYKTHRWAMVVDLDRCTGCHACAAACYAENNIGTVGLDNVRRGREMFWIRIDRYLDWGDPNAPVLFQPMLCQHCDAAPCEAVCPVYAAAQNDEGLNMQVYNRCIGTRFCANNCPYKVRRFNWFDYRWPEPLNWQLNPDVTVRCRGVMEKCTFCIQRIRAAELAARGEGRELRDGEVVPACVQTCPAGAFTFGDLKDPNSAVSRIFASDPRAYQVLAGLNTKPAVLYLKRIVDRS